MVIDGRIWLSHLQSTVQPNSLRLRVQISQVFPTHLLVNFQRFHLNIGALGQIIPVAHADHRIEPLLLSKVLSLLVGHRTALVFQCLLAGRRQLGVVLLVGEHQISLRVDVASHDSADIFAQALLSQKVGTDAFVALHSKVDAVCDHGLGFHTAIGHQVANVVEESSQDDWCGLIFLLGKHSTLNHMFCLRDCLADVSPAAMLPEKIEDRSDGFVNVYHLGETSRPSKNFETQ